MSGGNWNVVGFAIIVGRVGETVVVALAIPVVSGGCNVVGTGEF